MYILTYIHTSKKTWTYITLQTDREADRYRQSRTPTVVVTFCVVIDFFCSLQQFFVHLEPNLTFLIKLTKKPKFPKPCNARKHVYTSSEFPLPSEKMLLGGRKMSVRSEHLQESTGSSHPSEEVVSMYISKEVRKQVTKYFLYWEARATSTAAHGELNINK